VATYYDIFGQKVQYLASDPSPVQIGQVWYNSTSNTAKFQGATTAGAWATGGNLGTARDWAGNAGTKTAGLFMSGSVYPNVFKNETEEYNGTTWSEQNNVATARRTSGAGTQTAGIIVGGTNAAPGSTGVQTITEEYDGTNWAGGGSLSTARTAILASGEQTTVYAAGGYSSTDTILGIHEQYNGTSWTTSTAMNTDRMQGGAVGDSSSNLVFGGYTPPSFLYATSSEEWNGSSWTAGGNLNTARSSLASFGSQTNAVGAGGDLPGNSAATEIYDGSSWSTSTSMATARQGLTPGSSYNSSSTGMVAGGSFAGNPQSAATEEWTGAGQPVTQTITTS
jgi:hypothetical protein